MRCWWTSFWKRTPRRRARWCWDVADRPLYGQQEDRFFHGYYNEYGYLPLYIFCGDHLLCARQRTSNQDASAGSGEEVERIVNQIRSMRANQLRLYFSSL